MYRDDLVIDAHQHLWDLERASYPWLGPALAPLNRTIEFSELKPSLRQWGVDATILVQAADNDEDTDYMLQVASMNPEICAVVGYVPLDRPAEAALRLESLSRMSLFRGARTLSHIDADPDWLLRADVNEGLSLLADLDLSLDVAPVNLRQLRNVTTLAGKHPTLRLVIDHLAKPPVKQGPSGPWRALIGAAAEHPNVYAKISGLYPTSGDPRDWSSIDLEPFIEFGLEIFGARRLMFGSDWPICILNGGYHKVWSEVSSILDTLSAVDRHWILGQTALHFYRTPPIRPGVGRHRTDVG